jgi:hypothetical protein
MPLAPLLLLLALAYVCECRLAQRYYLEVLR